MLSGTKNRVDPVGLVEIEFVVFLFPFFRKWLDNKPSIAFTKFAIDQIRHSVNESERTLLRVLIVQQRFLRPKSNSSLRNFWSLARIWSGYRRLRRAGVIRQYEYWSKFVIVALAGVEHFNSDKVHCPSCLTRTHRNGVVSYHHAGLAAVLIHPAQAEVFPLDFEPILRQDGEQKNDCERNAAKRLGADLHQRYHDLDILLVEDALYANAPHVRQISSYGWKYVLNVELLKSRVRVDNNSWPTILWLAALDQTYERQFRTLFSASLKDIEIRELLLDDLREWLVDADKNQRMFKLIGRVLNSPSSRVRPA